VEALCSLKEFPPLRPHDDVYAITPKIFDVDFLIFGVWVGHEVDQFYIEKWPGAILGLVTRLWTQKKCNNSLNAGLFLVNLLLSVLLARVHQISPGFSIWPTFQDHRSKFVHAHLDDAYAITRIIFDVDFWFLVCELAMGWSSSLSKISLVRLSHSLISSFQFLYSPYPSPGAMSPSKCFTGCSLPAGGIQWCARTHCSARLRG
jgi:hypothetical protein